MQAECTFTCISDSEEERATQVVWSRAATVVAHALMAGLLLLRARATDLSDSKAIYSCYMFVWKLFYAEYLFIPLLR